MRTLSVAGMTGGAAGADSVATVATVAGVAGPSSVIGRSWSGWVVAGWMLMVSSPATAELGLVEVWRAAQHSDRELAVARASRESVQPKAGQASALWRPNVALSATAGLGSHETRTRGAQFEAPGMGSSTGVGFNTSVNGGSLARWSITAVQPLYNPERRSQQAQLSLALEAAELEWQGAQQSLMLRTAERYLELALAEEALRVLRLQQTVVQRAFNEARDRFDLGAVPVTDTHEARARLASIRAQVLAAENELDIRRQQLADSTGLAPAGLAVRLPQAVTSAAPPRSLEAWLADAENRNTNLRRQAVVVELARRESARHSLAAATTVDLVAQAARDRLSGSGDFGSAGQSSMNQMIGVQVSIPLYTGGYRDASGEEAQLLVEKSASQLTLARQQVAQQVRALWSRLSIGSERLQAFADGLTASDARRDATRTGLQVGHRTTQDLLNAESDLAAARLAWVREQVALLTDRLRLAAAAGQLDEAMLQAVDVEIARRQP